MVSHTWCIASLILSDDLEHPHPNGISVAYGGKGDLHRPVTRFVDMNVGIIGSSGFVGAQSAYALLERGHHPRLLIRPVSEQWLSRAAQRDLANVEAEDRESLRGVTVDADAVICNVGILREFPARGVTSRKLRLDGAVNAADLAREHGIRSFILMSANGVGTGQTAYQRTKLEAENLSKL